MWLGALGSCLPWAWRRKTHRRAKRGGRRRVGVQAGRRGKRGMWRQAARAVRSVATGNSEEVRHAGRLATRKLVQILLYVGCVERHPGPGQEERRARVGTLNAPGLHMLRRSRVGRVEETGWDDGYKLLSEPSSVLRTVRNMIHQGELTVMVLTETRMKKAEKGAVAAYMAKAGQKF